MFLESLRAPGLCFVDFVAFCFSFTKDQFPRLLTLVNADSCFGKYNLDTYQVFFVVGLSANMNVVKLGYVYTCGSALEDTWTRTWELFPDSTRRGTPEYCG